ncbi:FISUMP domain-containing protein [Flavobacterium sp.]|uniref:FISUMP domain-containing protein n=1 Tax=Flavobacterium sp. TaxID=239 RepID=UPI00262DD82C|nr:FISUMP domain-containing protein [Flavobacterium sp.]
MKQISKILFAIFLSTAVGCSSSEDNNGGQQPAGGPSVTAVTVVETRATSADVQAQVTDAGDTPVTVRGFVYGTSPLPNLNDFATENGAGTGTFSATLDGLQPNTTYYVRAYAINIDAATGNERISYSGDRQFQTTAAPALPTVNTLQVTDIKQISAKASGQLVNAGGSSINELGICFVEDTGSNPTPTINNWKVTAAETAGTFIVTLKGLTNNAHWIMPGKVYRYRAYAINQEGNVGYGETLEFTNNTAFTMAGPNCTDGSGNTYPTVILADKVWMARNLKTNVFIENSQAVTAGETNISWNTAQPRRCTPGSTFTQLEYGNLYNAYAAFSPLKLLPQQDALNVSQWRIPNRSDWEELIYYLGGTSIAGKAMKLSSNWNDGTNSNNSSGFSAISAGYRNNSGSYNLSNNTLSVGEFTAFWVNNPTVATFVELNRNSSSATINSIQSTTTSAANSLRFGFSVRCVRDNE